MASQFRARTASGSSARPRDLPAGMVDPVSILFDDMVANADVEPSSNDEALRSARRATNAVSEESFVDLSTRRCQSARPAGLSRRSAGRVSPEAITSADEDFGELESLLRGRRAGGRNWRGVHRPADVRTSPASPPGEPAPKLHARRVDEAQLSSGRWARRYGALDPEKQEALYSRGPARGTELGCSHGLSTQYSCRSDTWWKQSPTSGRRLQGEYHEPRAVGRP